MKNLKTNFLAFFFLLLVSLFFASNLFAARTSSSKLSDSTKISASEYSSDLANGYIAYSNADWISAVFFLRKAVSLPGSASDEALFLLIRSEILANDFEHAQSDCELFLKQFDMSEYFPLVQYHNGYLLHLLEKNEQSILTLTDFCHNNPESELYASALYWIAEAFYSEYNFDSARSLYERVVYDFPKDDKVVDAQCKIDMIDRRSREEKLLYLLKVTGEENLSAREDYDKQLRVYETEDRMSGRKQLSDAQKKISDLEKELATARSNNSEKDSEITRLVEEQAALKEMILDASDSAANGNVTDLELEALRAKAELLQYLLDKQEEKNEKK